MAELCYITTCMGRLAHLRQTLPRIAGQPDVECVVVDYSCPDRAGDWVEANFPQVRVGRRRSEVPGARAVEQRLSLDADDAPWLAFFDADVLIDPGFSATILPTLKPGHYFCPHPMTTQTFGALVVQRGDFDAMGGYDETFAGWGQRRHRHDAGAAIRKAQAEQLSGRASFRNSAFE